jgi:hypothetical protein
MQPHIDWRIDGEGRPGHVRAEAATIEATCRDGDQYLISIGAMDFKEASSLKFLLVPATFWHCPARCKLTEPSLEGHFTNALAVWTT